MEQEQPITILAVDDEPSITALVRRCLNDPHVTVVEASSGQDGLRRVAKGLEVDLLITDQRMPGMEGTELARLLRRADPNLKVLYLTSHADGLFAVKPLLWTAEAFLDKPFTRAGLREAVALLLFGTTFSKTGYHRSAIA